MLLAVEVHLTEPICPCPKEKRNYFTAIGNAASDGKRKVVLTCNVCTAELSSSIKSYTLVITRDVGTTKEQLEAEAKIIKERIDALTARSVEIDHALARLVST